MRDLEFVASIHRNFDGVNVCIGNRGVFRHEKTFRFVTPVTCAHVAATCADKIPSCGIFNVNVFSPSGEYVRIFGDFGIKAELLGKRSFRIPTHEFPAFFRRRPFGCLAALFNFFALEFGRTVVIGNGYLVISGRFNAATAVIRVVLATSRKTNSRECHYCHQRSSNKEFLFHNFSSNYIVLFFNKATFYFVTFISY